MTNHLAILLAALAFAAPAQAQIMAVPANPAQKCELKETATLTLTLNGMGENPEKIMSTVDGKVAELEALAKTLGITSFAVQNKNYSLNPNNYNGGASGYSYNANYSFIVEPGNMATNLLKEASAKGINAGININAYRQCN